MLLCIFQLCGFMYVNLLYVNVIKEFFHQFKSYCFICDSVYYMFMITEHYTLVIGGIYVRGI